MIIKIIPIRDNEQGDVFANQYVFSTGAYFIRHVEYRSLPELRNFLSLLGVQYFAPYGINERPIETSDGREIASITKDDGSAVVVDHCHVFIMNDRGKTVDSFTVS